MKLTKKAYYHTLTPKKEARLWKGQIPFFGGRWQPDLKCWHFPDREDGKRFLAWVQEHREIYGE